VAGTGLAMEILMPHKAREGFIPAAALLLAFVPLGAARAQTLSDSLPNPYRSIEN
jgi:hypothetical protein